MLAGDVARRLLRLAATLVLTRGLGPEMFGSFSLGLSVHNLGQQIARFGLPQAAVKHVSHHDALGDPARLKGAAETAVILSALFGAIIASAIVLAAPWLAGSVFGRPELTGLLRVFGWTVALSAPGAVLLGVLQGGRRFRPMVAIQSFAAPALLAGGYWLALRVEATPRSAATIFLAVATLQMVTAGAAVWWTVLRPRGLTNAQMRWRELLRFALPLAVIDASTFGVRGLDIVLLGALVTPEQLGIYAAAQPIALLVPFALAPVRMAFAPRIAAAHARNETRALRSALVMTTAWATVAGMTLLGLLAAFDAPVMRLLGRDFVAGAPVLLILAAGALVNCAVGAVGQVLIMTDRPWTVAADNLAATGLVVVGLLMVAPRGGVTAAAVVMGLAMAGVNLVRAWRVWREHGILPWDGRTARLWIGFAIGLGAILIARGALPGIAGRVAGMAAHAIALAAAAWGMWRDASTSGGEGPEC